MKSDNVIVIYDNKTTLPVNTVDTLQQAGAWLGCSVQALFKSLHVRGVMMYKGFTVEKVNIKGV